VTNPPLLARNCTPRFTGLESDASDAPDGAAPFQTLHGHDTAAAVVKPHVNGPDIVPPEPFCAPDTVAVYVTPAANAADGVNVATVFAPLNPTEPATDDPPEPVTTNDTELGTTASENVAVGATDAATPVAPDTGVTLDTDGTDGGAVCV
jgi:hypothetical protein